MLAAGLAEASRLGTSNHHGVEEIGDHIEFFAPEQPDRHVLLQRRMEENAAPVEEFNSPTELSEVSYRGAAVFFVLIFPLCTYAVDRIPLEHR